MRGILPIHLHDAVLCPSRRFSCFGVDNKFRFLLKEYHDGSSSELEGLPSNFPRFVSNRSLASLVVERKSQLQSYQDEVI